MKIASFTNCPIEPHLGSGKTVLQYTTGLRALGHAVDAFSPSEYEFMPKKVKGRKFRQAYGANQLLLKNDRWKNYDLIEFYGDEFWLPTRSLSRIPDHPLLVAHTNGLELLASERQKPYRPGGVQGIARNIISALTHSRFSQIAFKSADAFVSLCNLDTEYVIEKGLYPKDWTATIEPGLDSEYLSLPFRSNKEKRLVFTGSWIPRKGVETLVASVIPILKEHPEYALDICGAASQISEVKASFPADILSRVAVHPRLTEAQLAAILSNAEIYVFPTRYEGFGIATAEAMTASCAVVTTRTGFGGSLKNGQEAILCDFDSSEQFTAAIRKLISDPVYRTTLAKKGWERARALTWESNVAKLERQYLNWLERHRKGERKWR
ncbi:MAG: glycosyltransferase family 4 protein [Verrucomicrobiota bacterium]|nr:glycosyltransferase family 4 protein [Verrucomicrobiota bacterium]